MADIEKDERHCHDLLIKLKKTTEGLLANQSAQGPWGTYGALRRICDDAEAILCHRLLRNNVNSESVRCFWDFIQGLKWLGPNSAQVIDKINRLNHSPKTGCSEDCRAWLWESVQDHSLIKQLDILTSDEEHLLYHYYDDAFLCQPRYREAMKICFKAIELNKPALLAEISPQLLKSGLVESVCLEKKIIPGPREPHSIHLRKSNSDWKTAMGNRNSHLNVHYSSHLSSSNMSLAVDPSLGGSSLLQQKILSGPCFVSSLDSPSLLENLRSSDPLTDAMRSIQRSSTVHLAPHQAEHVQNRNHRESTGSERPHKTQITPSPPETADRHLIYHGDGKACCSLCDQSTKTSPSVDIVVSRQKHPESDSLSSFEDITHEADCLLREKSDSLRMEDSTPEQRTPHLSLVLLESPSMGLEKCYNTSSHVDIRLPRLSHASSTSLGSSGGQGNTSQMSESYSSQQGFSVKHGSHLSIGIDATLALSSHNIDESDQSSSGFNDSLDGLQDPGSKNVSYRGKKLANPKHWCLSNSDLSGGSRDSFNPINKSHIFSVKSDPSLNMPVNLSANSDMETFQSWQCDKPTSPKPWSDHDLYSMMSPGTSPVVKKAPVSLKSSGNIYIPQNIQPAAPSDPGRTGSLSPNFLERSRPTAVGSNSNNNSAEKTKSFQATSQMLQNKKFAHKRWVSDTSAIKIESGHSTGSSAGVKAQASSVFGGKSLRRIHQPNGHKASGWETESYQSTLTKPIEGQSLMSYLTSQDFNTCANLEKENAHFHISEALIAAFESMKWNRMMQKQAGGTKSSSSSSDEEINVLRQRIRVRKREKFLEKSRTFPTVSNGLTEMVSTSHSSPADSSQDVSSMSEDSNEDEDDGRDIDISMSSEGRSNLAQLHTTGLTLSLASLYSDAELARSNKQINRINTLGDSLNPGSAESIAISLLKKFSEKHLPKASELQWLVTEVDVPQPLLPLPRSIPISPDDAYNGDMSTLNKTRLRGNMEWAPPRQQIIFSIHVPEKREIVMSRQNYRCAGCGLKVDPALVKRYRYCEYLGKYFCQCCHTSETSIIPGYVLERWYFGRLPVSTFSHTLLEKIWAEPLFHLQTINPLLYKRVRVLETIRESRQQIVHLYSLLAVCKRDARVLKEMQALPSHWLTNDDSYSMADFIEVKTGTMLQRIRTFINVAVNHVSDCQLCQGLGFLCGMCHDTKVIFPFQLESVVTCQVCQSCYHKDCFVPDKCPKCIRMEARRKALQEPLSPDSPDSGNEDSTSSDKTLVSAGRPLSGSADEFR